MRLRRRRNPAAPRRITLADLTPGTYVDAYTGTFRIEAADLIAVQDTKPLNVIINLNLVATERTP